MPKPEPLPAPSPPNWTIQTGSCFVLFAYDAARLVKIEEAERRVHEATERQTIPHKRRAASYFEYQPRQLRVYKDIEPLNIGAFSARLPSLLFEGVNNTLKVLGDQYRLVNRRAQTGKIESIYEEISDQASNRRMEILEMGHHHPHRPVARDRPYSRVQ